VPASDNQAVEFPEGVVVEVFADLALELEADVFFIVPEFSCQSYHGNIVVILEFGVEGENISDIVLGVGAGINGQKPFESFYVTLAFVFIRQGT
jgi:hypothetical protein